MRKISIRNLMVLIILSSLLTSCDELNGNISLGESVEQTTITEKVSTVEDTSDTSINVAELIEFNDYTISKKDDGSFEFTITQEATEDCFYIISLMYDDRIIQHISGDGYEKSVYGKFASETLDEDVTTVEGDEDDDENRHEVPVTTVVTTSEEELQSLIGKEGKWTFKSISEGTQYIEIKLINKYGDVVYKSQFTCIVDTHLEPHIYYTIINY